MRKIDGFLHCFLAVNLFLLVSARGVPFPGIVPNQSPVENKGLYPDAKYVVSMNGESLKERIYDKNYATFLELYNSYCGFCKRFAPHWKDLSEELKNWRDIVQVAAIDCARDENSDICREFEVMAYPTIRYIPPKYPAGEKQIGLKVEQPNHEIMKKTLIEFLLNETNKQSFWPELTTFDGPNRENIFENQPSDVKMAILIVDSQEGDKNTTGIELLLDFHSTKQAVFRRTDTNFAFLPEITSPKPWIYGIPRSGGSIDNVLEPQTESFNKEKMIHRITNYLKLHDIDCDVTSGKSSTAYPIAVLPTEVSVDVEMEKIQRQKIKEKVKEMEGSVFRADLEMALRYTLFHEIPQFSEIKDERLSALKHFIQVVARYFPFGQNGVHFIKDLEDYVMNQEGVLHGSDFVHKIEGLEAKYKPVFSSTRWIGCYSDKENLRRFPCGLWTTFHHLTVAAENAEKSTDPLEVLQAMHGYIKYFFGCSECSEHFQAMAKRNKMWSVSSKDNAILWLWIAHNEVNKRLHGDITEDPEFPKKQFPTKSVCPQCYKEGNSGVSFNNNSEIDWDKTEVLFFLKKMHDVANISILGVDNETALPVPERLTSTRSFGRVFTDMDFRMGVLLYIFCIGMLIMAAKLFIKRHGYRKKMYVHDLLGKV